MSNGEKIVLLRLQSLGLIMRIPTFLYSFLLAGQGWEK